MNPFDSGSPRRSNSRRSNPGRLFPRAPGDAARARGTTGCGSDEINSSSASLLLCDVVAHDVAAYFDGEADDEAALRARRHLDACSGCAHMWRDWGDARLLLSTAALPEMPVHWPASLIQRARLQAMLPALFAPQAALPQSALDEHSHDSSVQGAFGTAPPRELRDAILARTTRAAEAKPSAAHPEAASQVHAAAFEPMASGPAAPEPVDWELSGGSLLRAQRYRLATRACASALAAWMLVLASVPSPQAPPQSGGPASTSAQSSAAPNRAEPPASAPARLAASPSRLAWPAASGRASAELLIEKVQPGARPTPVEDDKAALPGAAIRAPRWAGDPSASVSALPAPRRASSDESTGSSPEPAASADVGGGSMPTSRASSQRALEAPQPLAPRASTAGRARPSAALDPTPALAAAPRSIPIRSASADSSAVAPVQRKADRDGEAGAAAPARGSRVEVGTAQDAAGEESSRDGADPAPLAVDRELNDARPTEISDAVDAYAATWLDEGEGSLE